MSIRNPRERGSRRAAKRRIGDDFQSFDGMDLESDPGSIAENAFRHLENVDFRGELRARGGAELVNDDTFTGCQQFLTDFQPAAHRLYLTFIGLTGVSGSGRSVCWFDPDFSTTVQRMLYYPWATSSAILGIYGGDLYLGVDSFLKKLHLIAPISGEDPLASSGQTQDTVVASLVGYVIRAIAEFDAKLFIAAENIATPGNSAIYTWDGTTLRLDTSGIDAPTFMFPFRDKLIVGFAAATNLLKQRTLAGTYSNIAHSGTIATVDMATHKDLLYVADAAANIWRYDGTTLAIWRTITGATINSLESFNGFLWYVYKSAALHGILGRWSEASVFQDVYKDYTVDDPDITDATVIRDYRNQLYAVTSPSNITSMLVF